VICRPLAWGAHAVTHSLTKLVGGHSDLTLGLLAGSRQVVEGAGAASSAFGMNGSPFDCWLALRGLASLPLRSERVCRSALSLSERLAGDARLRAVHYPGLTSHPDHERACQLLDGGFGGIVTIDLGTRERANALIRGLAGIPFAPSLGDVTTTLSHPATTSHRGQTAEQWARQGITPGLVRLSVGLEDADSLWDELRSALELVG
jgi:cystathionine beta-lyase/cystathionine gamma-synthase